MMSFPSPFALVLPVLLGACAPPLTPGSDPYRMAIAQAPVRGDLRAVMLEEYNATRSDYGSAPLAWDDTLAAHATDYAGQMARTDRFVHDLDRPSRAEGENIWRGTRDAYDYRQMVAGMIREHRFFRAGAFPDVSRMGDWSDVGHYTQIVWPQTTRVGCAVESSARFDYLVCRYSPPGNIDGVFMASPKVLRPIR